MTPLVVGLAGGSCSGKSTFAAELCTALAADAVLLDHDSYYRDLTDRPVAERALVNFDHPDALETALLCDHLDALRRGESIDKPNYDFASHSRRTDTTTIAPRRVVIVEGILVLALPPLRTRFDLRVFIDSSADSRLARRLARDTARRGRSAESVRAQHAATVAPMHAAFVEPSREFADLVVWGDQPFASAVTALVATLRVRSHRR